MQLEGSCHCGSARFSVRSAEPVPFMRCYCSICRKTAGSGGYAINLGADAASLKVHKGRRELRVYRALLRDGDGERQSSAHRHFCRRCGSALWVHDPTWPDLIHPHAGAIDTPLPTPPHNVHIMLGSKAAWVEPEGRPGDARFDVDPDFSLAEWHARNALASDGDSWRANDLQRCANPQIGVSSQSSAASPAQRQCVPRHAAPRSKLPAACL